MFISPTKRFLASSLLISALATPAFAVGDRILLAQMFDNSFNDIMKQAAAAAQNACAGKPAGAACSYQLPGDNVMINGTCQTPQAYDPPIPVQPICQ